MKQHDAAIRREAYEQGVKDASSRPRPPCEECHWQEQIEKAKVEEREKVLGEILNCSETEGEWFRIDGTDFLYLNYSVLSRKAESLRSSKEK